MGRRSYHRARCFTITYVRLRLVGLLILGFLTSPRRRKILAGRSVKSVIGFMGSLLRVLIIDFGHGPARARSTELKSVARDARRAITSARRTGRPPLPSPSPPQYYPKHSRFVPRPIDSRSAHAPVAGGSSFRWTMPLECARLTRPFGTDVTLIITC